MKRVSWRGFRSVTRGVLAALVLFSATATTEAQTPTEDALAMFLNGRFPEAIAAYESVLDSPALTLETAVESHRYLVVLYDLTSKASAAQQHARAAAALDPAVQAPEGASAEAERLLRDASASAQRAAVLVEPVGAEREGEDVTIRSRVVHGDGLDLAQLRLHCSFAGEGADAVGDVGGTELTRADAQSPVRCDATAMTPHGAALLTGRLERELESGRVDHELSLATESDSNDGASTRRRRWVIGGTVAGAAVVAISVVLAVALTRSSNPQLGAFEPTFAGASAP